MDPSCPDQPAEIYQETELFLLTDHFDGPFIKGMVLQHDKGFPVLVLHRFVDI